MLIDRCRAVRVGAHHSLSHRSTNHVLFFASLAPPHSSFLINPLIPAGSLSLLYGLPGVGKSFVAISIAVALAARKPFLGRYPTCSPRDVVLSSGTAQRPVVYFTPEGVQGLRKRLLSALDSYAVGGTNAVLSLPLYIITSPFLLHTIDGQSAFLASMADLQADPALIIIDNLATYTPGMDENSAEEISNLLSFLTSLVSSDTCVLLLHHTNKSGIVPRGHSSLIATCDCIYKLSPAEPESHATLTSEKRKDSAPLPDISIRLEHDPIHDSCRVEFVSGPPAVNTEEHAANLLTVFLEDSNIVSKLSVREFLTSLVRRSKFQNPQILIDNCVLLLRNGAIEPSGPQPSDLESTVFLTKYGRSLLHSFLALCSQLKVDPHDTPSTINLQLPTTPTNHTVPASVSKHASLVSVIRETLLQNLSDVRKQDTPQ